MNADARKSPTGTVWTFLRAYDGPGRFRIIVCRSDGGATKYLDEDEWEDWPLA